MNVDERVYKLYLYLQDNEFNRDNISDLLEITPRQLSRLLNKWQEEGILEYLSGKGRGNASEVKFNVNVESHFANHLIHNIKSYDMQSLQEILQMPMSDSSRKLIKICIDESIFVRETLDRNRYMHMEYLYHIPNSLNPLSPIDISLLTLLNNIADTLYFIENNKLKSSIVIYDEWDENDLVIHLYRNIRYSNGDMLHAADIAQCIEHLLHNKKDTEVYADILGVEVLSANKLKIKMKKRKEAIKWALSKAEAGIFKEINGQYLFTGPYMVETIEADIIKLTYNPYYHHSMPYITTLLFVNDVEKYQNFYEQSSFKEIETHDTYNVDFILFNPKTKLNLEERGEIIRAINCIIDGQKYKPAFSVEKKFKFLTLARSKESNTRITSELKSLFNSIEVIETNIATYLEKHLDTFEVDLILMNEVIPRNQFYYELLTTGKFSEWYFEREESKNLLHIYNAKSADYWSYVEERYNNYMKENNLIVIIDKYRKTFYFPDNFGNVATDPYGIVFYNSIVVIDEGKTDDG
ncbi:ABC transporter substrate-binding protein [Macrococcus armenti]|uniref:SgrR family transcriptional regulator n=1 Tax=Macrococcus armenti TaxID=2875764 RepID=A0ABY3ZU50_9STAP|nr:ABC transporter substrate-binding protein [Macrococcus armenti]UOB20416.1 SgrR family transcriptional regulator [Macrococcus armenti]